MVALRTPGQAVTAPQSIKGNCSPPQAKGVFPSICLLAPWTRELGRKTNGSLLLPGPLPEPPRLIALRGTSWLRLNVELASENMLILLLSPHYFIRKILLLYYYSP